MKKSVVQTASASTLALFLAACSGAPEPEEVQKAGLAPLATPDRTLTCYDYNGNKVIQEKPTKDISFSSSGYAWGEYASSRKLTYVNGGAGCTGDTIYFDPNNSENRAVYDRAVKAAPYTVIVTNGMDKIIIADKFSSVSNSGGGVTNLQLKVNDVTIRNLSVQGMHVIATENREGIDPAIVEGLNAPKP